MTTSQPQYSYPAVAAVSGWLADTDDERPDGPTVGAGDVEADRARAGDGDVDLARAPRDTDPEPVGRADAREDARRTGADPDAV